VVVGDSGPRQQHPEPDGDEPHAGQDPEVTRRHPGTDPGAEQDRQQTRGEMSALADARKTPTRLSAGSVAKRSVAS